MTPAITSAIELAWWGRGRAIDIAITFKEPVTRRMVFHVWAQAKIAGRLPNVHRPPGGFDFELMLAMRAGQVPQREAA